MDARKATNEPKTANNGKSKDLTPAGTADGPADPATGAASGPRLQASIMRIRDAMAERQDAFESLREQERILLYALRDRLQAFAGDLPKDDDWVLLTLANGERPRYWVDPTSHVVIDRDRRTYRFLRDTRLGRIVVREDDDVKIIAQAVADYIAERMIERERAIDGEWLAAVQTNYDADTRRKDAERAQQRAAPMKRKPGIGVFAAGMALGMILIFGIWAFKDPALFNPVKSLYEAGLKQLRGSP